ncbi:MAG: DUF4058 family protein [Aggregatilineales bacterium]
MSNQFAGINPHLNSYLQQPDGGWETFHARHISDIATTLDDMLPPNYYAVEEKSLQINTILPPNLPTVRPSRTVPDVSVYQTNKTQTTSANSPISTPTLVFPVSETFDEEADMNAVIIYRIEDGNVPGKPVTRVEVLSTGNKPSGAHYRNYLLKRQQTLKSGLSLIEIDYLHETRPILSKIPSYIDREPESYPYSIIVSNPHPTLHDGETQVFGFNVDEALPTISLPLADDEAITVDIGQIYERTFNSRRLFQILADDSKFPINFDTYSEEDQRRIHTRMNKIN